MTSTPTRPGLTVRDSQILQLLEDGSPRRRVIEIGAYRRAWTAADVRRVLHAHPHVAARTEPPTAARTEPPTTAGPIPWTPPALAVTEPPIVVLTRRQAAVLEQLCHGHGNQAIARALYITEDTVKAHVKAVMATLGARDRTHAVVLALTGQVRVLVRVLARPTNRRAA